MENKDLYSSNIPDVSVSELARALKSTLEDRFGYVRVRGEIAGYRGPHASGHAYFNLKDASSRLDAVIWRTVFAQIKVKPVDGLEFVASGRVSTFPGRSSYQLVVETLEPAGVGALMALLEIRRTQLAKEGIFDLDRKTPLPYAPRVVGVVTSPTGSVIYDILHRLADRFPVHVVLWPVRVQGEGSAEEIATAIRTFSVSSEQPAIPLPEVLIVARGGGALEDLWSFNDEEVVRAVADCPIPIISAIGHETDWTLIDLAADVRAPTPTAAAEMCVPVRSDLLTRVEALHARQGVAITRALGLKSAELKYFSRGFPARAKLYFAYNQRLEFFVEKILSIARSASTINSLPLTNTGFRLSKRSPLIGLAVSFERLETIRVKFTSVCRQCQVAMRNLHRDAFANLRRRAFSVVQKCSANFAHTLGLWKVQRLNIAYAQLGSRRDTGQIGRSLRQQIAGKIDVAHTSLEKLGQVFEALHYKGILLRGFAIVLDRNNNLILRRKDAQLAKYLTLKFCDGEISASVTLRSGRNKSLPPTTISVQREFF